MSEQRFYYDIQSIKKKLVVTDQPLLHQWCHVLRLAVGDTVVLFDGSGRDVVYQIKALSKGHAELLHKSDTSVEPPHREVWLAWSLLKRENNELVIQKATELGVSHLVPLIADRCIRSHVSQVRSDRWQRIITEAAEQCGRGNLPKLSEPKTVTDILLEHEPGKVAVCRQVDNQQSTTLISSQTVLVMVGPEGGWSPAEEQLFESHNLATLQLGQFTLRAETAAVVAVAKVATS